MNAAPVSAQYSTTDLSRRYAGFWLRVVAALIDDFIVILPTLAMSFLTDLIAAVIVQNGAPWLRSLISMSLYFPLYYSFMIPYYAFFEASTLQGTPGKLALGLVVTDLEGNRLSLWRAIARNSCKILSDLTFFTLWIGYLLAGFTERKQALHDLMSGTLVIRNR